MIHYAHYQTPERAHYIITQIINVVSRAVQTPVLPGIRASNNFYLFKFKRQGHH